METEKTDESNLGEDVSTTQIYEILTQISNRLDSLEKSASNVETSAEKFPAAMSITTDAIDEVYSNALSSGIDIEERLKNGMKVLIPLTEPKTINSISLLLRKIDSLEPLIKTLDNLPNTLAVMVDSFDEMYKKAARSGVDIESLLKQASDTALRLNELLKSDELKALMKSGILNPKTVSMVGQAGCALANCKDDQPKRVGIVGLLKAILNHDLQHAVGFLIRFGKRFGQLLNNTK